MAFLPQAVYERRLKAEYEQLRQSGYSFTISPDFTEYEVTLNAKGFERRDGGTIVPRNQHKFRLKLKREYPYAGGLEAIWVTPLFHPNIRESDGKVCIQLINEWAASQTVASVVKAVDYMLTHPNPRSPLNIEAARFFDDNPSAFDGKYEFKRPRIVVK